MTQDILIELLKLNKVSEALGLPDSTTRHNNWHKHPAALARMTLAVAMITQDYQHVPVPPLTMALGERKDYTPTEVLITGPLISYIALHGHHNHKLEVMANMGTLVQLGWADSAADAFEMCKAHYAEHYHGALQAALEQHCAALIASVGIE